MLEDNLEVSELLQAHESRNCVERESFGSLSVDGTCQGLSNFSFLNATAAGYFFQETLACLSSLSCAVSCHVSDQESFESVSHAQDFFV